MMTLEAVQASLQAAVTYLQQRDRRSWRVLIILGSGLGALADEVEDALRIPYADIPGFAPSTVQGHKGQLVIGKLAGVTVAVMQGRMHFYEGYPLWQVTLPVRVARLMGADTMIITNAAGGINRDFRIADLMLISRPYQLGRHGWASSIDRPEPGDVRPALSLR
jgi:purine-nucleoside phosphorylase